MGVCSRGKLGVGLPSLPVGLEVAAGGRPELLTRSGDLERRVGGVLLGGPCSSLSTRSGGRVSGESVLVSAPLVHWPYPPPRLTPEPSWLQNQHEKIYR